MRYDPVLRELHKAKDKIARDAGYDIHRLCEWLREKEKEHPERMATLKPAKFLKKRAAKKDQNARKTSKVANVKRVGVITAAPKTKRIRTNAKLTARG